MEDISEEDCDADVIYVVLQNQRERGRDLSTADRSFENKLHSIIR
jgi:hypothetical protein